MCRTCQVNQAILGGFYCHKCSADLQITSSEHIDFTHDQELNDTVRQATSAASSLNDIAAASTSTTSTSTPHIFGFNPSFQTNNTFHSTHTTTNTSIPMVLNQSQIESIHAAFPNIIVSQKTCHNCSVTKSKKWITIDKGVSNEDQYSCLKCFHKSRSTVNPSTLLHNRASSTSSTSSSVHKKKSNKHSTLNTIFQDLTEHPDHSTRTCNLCETTTCTRWVRDKNPDRPSGGYLCPSCYAASRSGAFLESDGITLRRCNTCNVTAARRWVKDVESGGGYNCNPCNFSYISSNH